MSVAVGRVEARQEISIFSAHRRFFRALMQTNCGLRGERRVAEARVLGRGWKLETLTRIQRAALSRKLYEPAIFPRFSDPWLRAHPLAKTSS